MTTEKTLDFWFSIGSTYTWLSVMRAEAVEAESGVTFRWRPFNIRHVLIEHNNIPFADKPVKSAYMWRDIQRWADRYGLSPKLPAPYPTPDSPLANQVALIGAREGWIRDYVKATYRRWFEDGQFCGEDPNLSASLEDAGQDPARVIAEARSDETIAAMLAETEEAMALGLFGAPTFAVEGELFWGNDRMEDAVAWAKTGQLAAR